MVLHSANLVINWANSGLNPLFINNGIIVVESIDHLLTGLTRNNVDIAVNINNSIISNNPLKSPLPSKLDKEAIITTPILLFLNTLISIEASNISINVRPVPSREWVKYSQKSLLFFIVLAPRP